jgi:hypothetical protein
VLGIHHTCIKRVLEKKGVDLLLRTVVKKLAVVPTLKAETISIEAETPSAGWRGSRFSRHEARRGAERQGRELPTRHGSGGGAHAFFQGQGGY